MGMDVARKLNGDTPLIAACGAISVEIIEFLLKEGADVNCTYNFVSTMMERFIQ